MERRRFGSTGREVPVIGQGTWELEHQDRSVAVATLRRGLDLGMAHIDTAEMYGSGAAEEIVGAAIEGRREEVFLVSKVLPHNASRRGTVTACERSLARMRTDHLDCYLLHWRGSHPLEETIAAFQELERDGKILSWGVSNFNVSDLEEARALGGKDRPACNQVLYHLYERAIEHGVLPWCDRRGVAVVGYSPFGHGQFPPARAKDARAFKELGEIAAHHGVTARQVALRFLTRRAPLFTIPKASTPPHAEDNARGGDLKLTDEELARIDAALPLGPPPRELPML